MRRTLRLSEEHGLPRVRAFESATGRAPPTFWQNEPNLTQQKQRVRLSMTRSHSRPAVGLLSIGLVDFPNNSTDELCHHVPQTGSGAGFAVKPYRCSLISGGLDLSRFGRTTPILRRPARFGERDAHVLMPVTPQPTIVSRPRPAFPGCPLPMVISISSTPARFLPTSRTFPKCGYRTRGPCGYFQSAALRQK
jgi:hypothetical protein